MNHAEPPRETPSPQDMPGLDVAYGFVQPSYQWALARFEAGNTRLQTMLTVIVSASLAVPAVAGALNRGPRVPVQSRREDRQPARRPLRRLDRGVAADP